MAWYDIDGKLSEHILFSKFTYTRNLSDTLFFQGLDKKKMTEIITRTDAILKKNGFHAKDSGQRSVMAYYEKQFLDYDVCIADGERAIYFNEPCNLSLSVGGSNLFNIYSILPGAAVSEAHRIASSAESLLDSELDFAYNESIGYLSPTPHLCGSGARISSALYLPLLTKSCRIPSLMASLYSFGATMHPLFSHSSFGDIYILSYTIPKDMDEDSAISLFEGLVSNIIELETQQEGELSEDELESISDNSHRALGVLEYATRLSEEETISLLSSIRLSLCVGSELSRDVRPSSLCGIMCQSLSSVIVADSRKKITSDSELMTERAATVKRLLRAIPEKHPSA